MAIHTVIFIIFLLFIMFTELFLSATWNKYYYLYGIPIFIKKLEISNVNKAYNEIHYFINNIETVKGFKKFDGIMLDKNIFAFRKKKIGSYSNFDTIHGTIKIDSEKRRLEIRGYMEYIFPAMLLFIPVFFALDSMFSLADSTPYLICLLFVYLISFVYERIKYNQLVKVLEDLING